jgi:uncharacterized secreted protein with C-terminal beta-propeller domain
LLSQIIFDDEMYPVGLFVSGDRLVVLGSKYNEPQRLYYPEWGFYQQSVYVMDVRTFAYIYDIADKTAPKPLNDFMMSGNYFNSRMIGNYVYFVIGQPAYVVYDRLFLPTIYGEYGAKEIAPTEIHYFNMNDTYFQYTTFVALNMQDATETPTYLDIMLGGTSGMYVSMNNIYVTYQKWYPDETSIYRLRIDGKTINFEANGTVPGRGLNQFSMDEHDDYFRIVTTSWVNGIQNNLYVLNMNLSIVGKLEDIAPGETLDSTRFMGNRCYLSTSVIRRDPFFVIDLTNATAPKILGDLKIPGFMNYLHPYDEDHVIGVGRDNEVVKISLFDVTNVTAPKEIDKFTFQGSWSETTVLTEHKAFLFEKSKDLLVIPVSISNWGQQTYSLWQGVYVFNVTVDDGFGLRGTVSHQTTVNNWDSGEWINRALYIDDVLYTVSQQKIKLSSLIDLAFIKEITIP